MDNTTLPQARAIRGFGDKIFVPDCPYCHGQHSHWDGGPGDNFVRPSDCSPGGQYQLIFENSGAEETKTASKRWTIGIDTNQWKGELTFSTIGGLKRLPNFRKWMLSDLHQLGSYLTFTGATGRGLSLSDWLKEQGCPE